MEGLPPYKAVIRVIQEIAGQRVADSLHMDPDLVRAPGVQRQQEERTVGFRIIAQKAVMSARRFPSLGINTPLDGGAVFAGDGKADRPLGFRPAAGDGQILPSDRLIRHHGGEDGSAQHVFSDEQKAGRIAIQPVDGAEDEGLPLLPEVPDQTVGQSV